MLDLTLSTSLTSPLAIGAPGLASVAGDFAAALADLSVPGASGPVTTPVLQTARQPLAETGNALPEIGGIAMPAVVRVKAQLSLSSSDGAGKSSADSAPVVADAGDAQPDATDTALVGLLEASGDASPAIEQTRTSSDHKKKHEAAAASIDSASAVIPPIAGPAPAEAILIRVSDAASSADAATTDTGATNAIEVNRAGASAAAAAPAIDADTLANLTKPAPTGQADVTTDPTTPAKPLGAEKQALSVPQPISAGVASDANVLAAQAASSRPDTSVQPSPARLPMASLVTATDATRVSGPGSPIGTQLSIGVASVAEGKSTMGGVVSPHLPTTSLAPPTTMPDAQAAGRATQAPLPHIVDATSAAPAPPAATSPQVAGMVFGFALSGSMLPSRRADATEPSPREIALQALSAAAGSAQVAGTVVATGHAQQTALDMRRDDWPQTMIDHIEALRDAADATSTRITLMPDALGKVDVSIRHDGDAVHVHFAADVPQTRTMLADAQPRLAEAAQVRGVKLGQATVDAGGGEAGRQQPQQQQNSANPALPPRPASAMAIEDDAAAPVSTRLA